MSSTNSTRSLSRAGPAPRSHAVAARTESAPSVIPEQPCPRSRFCAQHATPQGGRRRTRAACAAARSSARPARRSGSTPAVGVVCARAGRHHRSQREGEEDCPQRRASRRVPGTRGDPSPSVSAQCPWSRGEALERLVGHLAVRPAHHEPAERADAPQPLAQLDGHRVPSPSRSRRTSVSALAQQALERRALELLAQRRTLAARRDSTTRKSARTARPLSVAQHLGEALAVDGLDALRRAATSAAGGAGRRPCARPASGGASIVRLRRVRRHRRRLLGVVGDQRADVVAREALAAAAGTPAR